MQSSAAHLHRGQLRLDRASVNGSNACAISVPALDSRARRTGFAVVISTLSRRQALPAGMESGGSARHPQRGAVHGGVAARSIRTRRSKADKRSMDSSSFHAQLGSPNRFVGSAHRRLRYYSRHARQP